MAACNIYPRKTWHPLSFGTVVEALGITLLPVAIRSDHLPTIYGMLALTGVGTGVRFMPGTLHGVGYYRTQIAAVVSIMSFAHAFGGTVSSTIMLNIFNNRMSEAGIDLVNAGSSTASSFESIAGLPEAQQEFIRNRAKDAIIVAFFGISSFMWLGVVAMAFLGNVNIRKDTNVREGEETDSENLSKGPYIATWFRKRSDGAREEPPEKVEQRLVANG
jgi:hypothetical protein